MRLYFFPALLPLAPMIPWLLTALATVAAALRRLNHHRKWARIAGVLLMAAIGTAWYQKSRLPSDEVGSQLTAEAALPQATRMAPDPASDPKDTSDRKKPGEKHRLVTEAWFQMTAHRALSASLAPGPAKGWLLVGNYEGDLLGVSTLTGEIAWTLKKSEPILAEAAFFGTTAFVGEGLHTAISSALTAVDIPTGKALWQRVFLGHIETAPSVDSKQGRVYVTTGPHGLWSLRAQDGAVLWHAKIGHVDSTPLLVDGKLWVTAQPDEKKPETRLRELDPESGNSRFEAVFPGQPWGVPRAVGNLIAFSTGIGQVGATAVTDQGWAHAFNRETRTLAWTVPLETMALPQNAISPVLGLVFHVLKSGKIRALNLRDGTPAWTAELGAPCLSGPSLIEDRGLLLVFPSDGKLAFLDARSGKILDRIEVGANATAGPIVDDTRLFTIAGDSFSAFDLNTR